MKLKKMTKKQLRKEVKNLQEITAGMLILFSTDCLDIDDIEYLLKDMWDSMSGESIFDIGAQELTLLTKLLKEHERLSV